MQLARLLSAFADAQVGVILIGGVAARAHGASRFTQDIDFAYARDDANLERLVTALAPAAPYLRGAPPGLPFEWTVETLRRGLNFTLTTAWGDVDLFGEIPGGGGYEDLLPRSEVVTAFGRPVRLLSLDWLIHVKRSAGRPKDLEVLAELEVIREERDR